jgi:hypothetical protein
MLYPRKRNAGEISNATLPALSTHCHILGSYQNHSSNINFICLNVQETGGKTKIASGKQRDMGGKTKGDKDLK